jgi:cyclopropane fatty-acyl-phospholipid synthase-like methyltransferase
VIDSRVDVVAQGYDVIADEYVEWRDRIVGDPRLLYLDELGSRLSPGARVLELGCGAGVPDTRLLAERFRVTGVDVSFAQIGRARANVPGAQFLHADLTTLELDPSSFDAVAAIYVLNHVPRVLLPALFSRIVRWLTPGGLFLASLGTGDEDEWTGDWLGTTMFFSSFDPDTNRRLLADAGFVLVLDELVTMQEPDDDGFAEATFQWVVART